MRTNAQLQEALAEHGLFIRGVTRLTNAEIEAYGVDPETAEIALVGNIGSSYWPVFSQAPEFDDGAPDPLDRWSRRIAEGVAGTLTLRALYPFDGPPYYPFQQWAKRAEGLMQSPLGILMHPEIGLWHSYRFALLGADFGARDALRETEFPCLDCKTKPCLHSCPVDAFDGEGYAVAVCAAYLRSTADAECNQRGCLARYACPVAPDLRYLDAQGSFHLRAFVNANHDYE
jgi:hypothetical protein